MIKRCSLGCCLIIGLLVSSLSAVELSTNNEDLKLSLNANGSFWFGQVARGTGIEGGSPLNNLWTENANAGISFEAIFDRKLKLVLGINAETKFSWPIEPNYSQSKTAQPIVSMDETYGLYTSNGKLGSVDLCAGYFAFKYNPDVRNLGEYMFRSATYPAYIKTDFDYPKAKLLGFRLGHTIFDSSFTHNFILATETVFFPSMDWSLSYLFDYDLLNMKFIDIGAGFSWAHLFSVYDKGNYTTPKNIGSQGNQYITPDGDTAFYTFKGNKLMTRFSVDPLAFTRKNNKYFGDGDFKIYGELLVIGLKSYPDTTASGKKNPSYSNWKEKAPVTFGINLPSFRIIDTMSLEFEYWGSKYYNDYRQIYVVDGQPMAPGLNEGVIESKWKWSLYMKKSFYDNKCAITTQFARDHMRMFDALYDRANHREMLVRAGDWWWVTKLSFSF